MTARKSSQRVRLLVGVILALLLAAILLRAYADTFPQKEKSFVLRPGEFDFLQASFNPAKLTFEGYEQRNVSTDDGIRQLNQCLLQLDPPGAMYRLPSSYFAPDNKPTNMVLELTVDGSFKYTLTGGEFYWNGNDERCSFKATWDKGPWWMVAADKLTAWLEPIARLFMKQGSNS
jgi:hypothetical protein